MNKKKILEAQKNVDSAYNQAEIDHQKNVVKFRPKAIDKALTYDYE